MTPDEYRLLRHGIFWAAILGGSAVLVSLTHNRVIILPAMFAWWLIMYVVFKRDAK